MPTKASALKEAHYELLGNYFSIISMISTLPFFVDVKYFEETRQAKHKNWLHLVFLNSIGTIGKIRRFLSLLPLVKLFAESHIKSKLKEMRIAYLQYSLILTPQNADLKAWIINATDDLNKFEQTLHSWKNITDAVKSLLPAIIAGIVAIFGLNNIFDVIPRIIGYLSSTSNKNLIWLATIALYFVILSLYMNLLIELPFSVKRLLFLKNNLRGQSTYEAENNLFKSLGRNKIKEFPIDLGFQIIFAGLNGIIVGTLFELEVIEKPTKLEMALVFLALAGFSFATIISWRDRKIR